MPPQPAPDRFCPSCGHELSPRPIDGRLRLACPACGRVLWRNAKPCAGALVVRNGKVLLVRRACEPFLGYWDIPGGFCEADEHPTATARREVREETGLEVELIGLLGLWLDDYQEQTSLNVYYLARPLARRLELGDDVNGAAWFSPRALPPQIAFEHARKVLSAWASDSPQPLHLRGSDFMSGEATGEESSEIGNQRFSRRGAGAEHLGYPYRDRADVERMRDLLISMRAAGGHNCWHVGDLVWRLFLQAIGHDLTRTVRLWDDDDGSLAGFAILTPSRSGKPVASFDLQLHPRLRGRGLEDEMLGWAEADFKAAFGSGRLYVEPGVYEGDVAQMAALERRGYRRAEEEGLLMLKPLDGPLPAPALPPGWTVRVVAGEHELAARAAAHHDAFNPSRVTDEAYLRLMRTPGYDRELDMVAVAPDGTLAAFSLGWLDEANGVGEFEPVGTREAFRGQGLAQAVLLEGMRRMRARGAEAAIVGPIEAGEPAVVHLYEAVGFRPLSRLLVYTREV